MTCLQSFIIPVLMIQASGLFAQAAAASEGRTVGPGVVYRHVSAPGPLSFNIMQVQLDNPQTTIEAESAQDRLFLGEKVPQTAKREGEPGKTQIVGAVNGDFFSLTRHFPLGLLVADGMIYDMPAPYRSAFVLTKDETPFIGHVTLQVLLKVKNTVVKIDKINNPKGRGKGPVLFTAPYGAEVGPASGTRFLLSMQGSEFLPNQPLVVKVTKADSRTSTALSAGTMVLQVPPAQAKTVGRIAGAGETATLTAILPEVKEVVASVCGGGPSLLTDGNIDVRFTQEKMEHSHLQKHPRTAVGFTRDRKTVFFVTVDGRQPRLSIGLTLDELAVYMKSLGCWSALNLDGGGSTSMVVNGKVVNSPCDLTGPRTVADSLLVVSTVADASTSGSTAIKSQSPGNLGNAPAHNY